MATEAALEGGAVGGRDFKGGDVELAGELRFVNGFGFLLRVMARVRVSALGEGGAVVRVRIWR